MCKERPIACRTNATFVLDTSSLEQRDDYKADDNGSFRHHGKKIEFVELNDEGDVVKLHIKPAMLKEGQYKLSRTYWVHTEVIQPYVQEKSVRASRQQRKPFPTHYASVCI